MASFSLSSDFKHMLAFLIFWLTSARRRHCRPRCQAAFFFYNCLCMRKPRRMCRQNWLGFFFRFSLCLWISFAFPLILLMVATCLYVFRFFFFCKTSNNWLQAELIKECNSHLCSIKSNLKRERERSYWERTVTWQCQIKQYIFYISSTFLTTNNCTLLCVCIYCIIYLLVWRTIDGAFNSIEMRVQLKQTATELVERG